MYNHLYAIFRRSVKQAGEIMGVEAGTEVWSELRWLNNSWLGSSRRQGFGGPSS
jgi:hypothetical protein